ncbi:MAG: transposase [Synergistaceae bacterium]|nr:transposase [Synergistaceae bacterium]
MFEVERAEALRAEKSSGIGFDLGIRNFAVVSDGREYHNINKSKRMRKLTKRLKHEQHKFMRKIRYRKEDATGKCKRSNLDKQRLKVQRAYMRLSNKRHDYINKTVHEIVRTQPEYITIENLNVSGMMKNRHLSRAIAECEFWYFRALLERKCREFGIQLRIAGRFYASSITPQ